MKRTFRTFFCLAGILATAHVYSLSPGSGVLYYVHNGASDVSIAMPDESAQVVWTAEIDPFGGAKTNQDSDGNGVPIEFNARFPGQYYLQRTGLNYNYSRTHYPETGRYMTPDPIGLDGGLNMYAYVGSNPISSYDPLGLYQMCHRDLLMPIPYARHCYIRFGDGTTSSYDPSGVNTDPDPDQAGATCTDSKDPEKDNCIRRAMQKCKGSNYSFTQFNCCHCAEQAMKECGASIPHGSWPNWPINPGPQPGEPGYSPLPIYDPSLGVAE